MALRSSLSPLTSSLRASRSLLRTTPAAASFAATRTYAALTVTTTRSNASAPSLNNIEAVWVDLGKDERYEVYKQLIDLQKKDWKELSMDEKKAGE